MKIDLPLITKIIAAITTLFWKNSEIIYIDSNIKVFDIGNIDEKTKTRNKRIVNCQTISKLGNKKDMCHLFKMKFHLFQILKNCTESANIVYCGYASPMFSIYDGYCLGDNRNYTFIDTRRDKNLTYMIDYKKKYTRCRIDFDYSAEEINILVSSSFTISHYKCKKCKSYEFNNRCKDTIDCNYLNLVYSYIRSVLEISKQSSVKRVNLYVAARQPVSFIIGTAIQSSDPPVFVYKFENNEYCGSLLIQEAKIKGRDVNDR